MYNKIGNDLQNNSKFSDKLKYLLIQYTLVIILVIPLFVIHERNVCNNASNSKFDYTLNLGYPLNLSPKLNSNLLFTFNFSEPHSSDSITLNGYAKPANIDNWPALQGLGISQSLFLLHINGSNSPHHHPDGVEILYLIEGLIEVVRVEPNGGKIYHDILEPDMSTVFPRGHVHFQRNLFNGTSKYISSLNSERPGVYSLAQRTCELPTYILKSAFSNESINGIIELCQNLQKNPILIN